MNDGRFKKGLIPWNKGLKAKDYPSLQKSVEAMHKASTGKPAWNRGKPSPFKGLKRDKSIGEKISKILKSRNFRHTEKMKKEMSEKFKGIHRSPKTEFKKGHNAGEKSNLWKGGVTPLNRKIRTSTEYKLWRRAVFERDFFTCIWCGYKGKYIHADHIKPFAYFPELRLAIDNGRTLCIECHRKTDTYGFNRKNK